MQASEGSEERRTGREGGEGGERREEEGKERRSLTESIFLGKVAVTGAASVSLQLKMAKMAQIS